MKLTIHPRENHLDHEIDYHLFNEQGLSICVALSADNAEEVVNAVNNHKDLVEMVNRFIDLQVGTFDEAESAKVHADAHRLLVRIEAGEK